MRLDLVLELLDVPGQLLDVMEPISAAGANIVTIIHQRDVKTEKGMVSVQVTIEGDKETLDAVLNLLRERNVNIVEIDGVIQKEKIRTIIIGKIIESDIKDTIERLNNLEGVLVADLDLKMAEHPKESAAKIIVEADFGMKRDVMNKIKEIGEVKNFLVINEI
ncbi:MAG: amino acid-binding protein [Methanobacteriaceae archaeon]|nr:amino acid-binding protein [Methanobacteriaceae archaeon]